MFANRATHRVFLGTIMRPHRLALSPHRQYPQRPGKGVQMSNHVPHTCANILPPATRRASHQCARKPCRPHNRLVTAWDLAYTHQMTAVREACVQRAARAMLVSSIIASHSLAMPCRPVPPFLNRQEAAEPPSAKKSREVATFWRCKPVAPRPQKDQSCNAELPAHRLHIVCMHAKLDLICYCRGHANKCLPGRNMRGCCCCH